MIFSRSAVPGFQHSSGETDAKLAQYKVSGIMYRKCGHRTICRWQNAILATQVQYPEKKTTFENAKSGPISLSHSG